MEELSKQKKNELISVIRTIPKENMKSNRKKQDQFIFHANLAKYLECHFEQIPPEQHFDSQKSIELYHLYFSLLRAWHKTLVSSWSALSQIQLDLEFNSPFEGLIWLIRKDAEQAQNLPDKKFPTWPAKWRKIVHKILEQGHDNFIQWESNQKDLDYLANKIKQQNRYQTQNIIEANEWKRIIIEMALEANEQSYRAAMAYRITELLLADLIGFYCRSENRKKYLGI